ncbi:hypothetical protein KEM55_000545 [Ascosphaera atra]|nr:hypothetical protein KEM55_000545 [Ascosphaera atra]
MMMDWYNNLPGYKKREAQSQFSEELYSQILRCFSFSVDPRGAVVALYSLKHTFDFAPDSEVALIIISALTRLAQVKTVPGGGRTRSRASRTIQRNDRRLEQVGYLMEYLRDTKIAALGKEGMSLEDLTPEERRNLQLEILADSLRIFLNRLSGHYNSTEAEIRQAAEQMGVSCDVGKPVTDIS